MKIVRKEGLEQDERINTPGDYFFNRVMLWAETKICFYECAECSKPYYGGLIDCEQEMGMQDTTRREDLVCRECLTVKMSFG